MKLAMAAGCWLLGAMLASGQSHMAVSGLFTVDTRGGQLVYPSVHTNVLAGALAGGAIPNIVVNYAAGLNSYLVLEVDQDSTSSAVVPADQSGVDANIWRVDVAGVGYPVLNAATKVRPRKNGAWLAEVPEAWGVDLWRGARYGWKLYQTSGGDPVASGTFDLGYVGIKAGAAQSGAPVVLLHGILARRDKWESAADFVGQLGGARPVYSMEYPNSGDIAASAKLLGLALQRISAAHGGQRVHVVAHSMGGVVSQYYQQKLAGAMGNKMDRLATLGSPMEGSGYAEALSADGWKEAIKLASLGMVFDELDYLGNLNSTAMNQLSNPQQTLGLACNDSSAVKTDDWLAACGTRKELLLGKGVINMILTDGYPRDPIGYGLELIKKAMTYENNEAIRGSDGVVSWHSALKRPLEEPANLYYKANHLTYFSYDGLLNNRDYSAMVSDINAYLADGMNGVAERIGPRPLYDYEVVILTAHAGIRQLANAAVYVGQETVQLLGVFAADGRCKLLLPAGSAIMARSSGRAAKTATEENTIYVHAPGYLPESIGYVEEDGSAVIETPEVELAPDPAWNKPRNPSLGINDGAWSTTSPTVQLKVQCDNATQMAIFDLGAESPVWQPYAGGVVTVAHTFASSAPGEKTAVAAFRNGNGDGPAATASIVLVAVAQTGALAIEDTVGGGAAISLNGQILPQTTPATLSGLPAGQYTVALIMAGVQWEEPFQTATVLAGQTTTVVFDPQMNDLGNALDAPELDWRTGGDADWFVQTVVTQDGESAAQSGAAMADDQTSWIETTVEGPGTIAFSWRVSSEEGCDILLFLIDDEDQVLEEQDNISGDMAAFEHKLFSVPAGTHVLRWQYYKDSSDASYSDCGWLDQVEWIPLESMLINPTVTNISASASSGHQIGVTANVSWTATPNANSTWITITGGSSGNGDGTVTYSVATNGGALARTGGVVLAGGGISITCSVIQVSAAMRPQAQADSSFGMVSNRFGFNINWTSGRVVVVDAATNLTQPNWIPVAMGTLSGGPYYFSDTNWTNYIGRYYRIRSP